MNRHLPGAPGTRPSPCSSDIGTLCHKLRAETTDSKRRSGSTVHWLGSFLQARHDNADNGRYQIGPLKRGATLSGAPEAHAP